MFKKFLKDESGQGMVEYALIIALIAVAVIAAITALSGAIGDKFGEVSDNLNSNGGAGNSGN